MIEHARQERSLVLLLSLTGQDFLKQRKFTEVEIKKIPCFRKNTWSKT